MKDIILSIFSSAALIGDILVALGLILLFSSFNNKLRSYLSKNAIPLAFLIAVVATVGSLSFSEVLGFVPCKLCWFQRIFMYPQVVILGVAVFKSDVKVRLTSLILSVIGLGFALYHILVQTYPAWFECSDETANCALVQFKYYGYITIPVMSATAFALIILLMLFSLKKGK